MESDWDPPLPVAPGKASSRVGTCRRRWLLPTCQLLGWGQLPAPGPEAWYVLHSSQEGAGVHSCLLDQTQLLSPPVPGLPSLLEPISPEEALHTRRSKELVSPPQGSQVGFMSLVGRRQILSGPRHHKPGSAGPEAADLMLVPGSQWTMALLGGSTFPTWLVIQRTSKWYEPL